MSGVHCSCEMETYWYFGIFGTLKGSAKTNQNEFKPENQASSEK